MSAGRKIQADQVDVSEFRKKHMYLGILSGERIDRIWGVIGYDLVKDGEEPKMILLFDLNYQISEILLWYTGENMDLGLR